MEAVGSYAGTQRRELHVWGCHACGGLSMNSWDKLQSAAHICSSSACDLPKSKRLQIKAVGPVPVLTWQSVHRRPLKCFCCSALNCAFSFRPRLGGSFTSGFCKRRHTCKCDRKTMASAQNLCHRCHSAVAHPTCDGFQGPSVCWGLHWHSLKCMQGRVKLHCTVCTLPGLVQCPHL